MIDMILKSYISNWCINISYAYGTSEVGLATFSLLSKLMASGHYMEQHHSEKQNYLDSEWYTSPGVQVLIPTCNYFS